MKVVWYTVQCAGKELPQGTVLSPLLYTIYTNDLAVSISPDVNFLQFADDVAVYTTVEDVNKARTTLENTIEDIAARILGLKLQANKTVVMHFHPQEEKTGRNRGHSSPTINTKRSQGFGCQTGYTV